MGFLPVFVTDTISIGAFIQSVKNYEDTRPVTAKTLRQPKMAESCMYEGWLRRERMMRCRCSLIAAISLGKESAIPRLIGQSSRTVPVAGYFFDAEFDIA